jgi:DNA primase large subunit
MYLIEELPKMHLGREYVLSGNQDEVKIEDLDTLAKQSMPPCMQLMHTHLRTKHHLKHFGRLSYSLFLKGIGVSLEAALEFWREELEGRGGRNFDKEFAYNFKHSYGSVGKRTSYTPYACHKIIDEPAVEGGVHGCPFKTSKNDKGQLKSLLQVKEVSGEEIQEIFKLSNEGQYQMACKCLFDRQHPGHGFPIESMNHPNRYFDLSLQYIKQQQQMKEWENQKMEVEQQKKVKGEST